MDRYGYSGNNDVTMETIKIIMNTKYVKGGTNMIYTHHIYCVYINNCIQVLGVETEPFHLNDQFKSSLYIYFMLANWPGIK